MTAPAHPLLAELRRLRLEHGWTQDDIARRLYVSGRSILNWEHGKRQPVIGGVTVWAEALGWELVLRRRVDEQAAEHRAVLAAALGFADDYEPSGEVA